MGFTRAQWSGVTIAFSDIQVPPEKEAVIKTYEERTDKINEQYIMDSSAQGEMTKALNLAFISESHDSDFITENDVYAVLNGLNLAGLTVLDVNLVQGGNAVPYINVPVSRIPKLTGITYNNVGLEE
jgi:hypothetical protein